MRAITLWRPWPWALFHAPADRLKDVENRTWAAPYILGETVALHAGHRIDKPEAFHFIERVCGVRPPEDAGATGIIGLVRFDAMLTEASSPWFTGKVGWHVAWRQALAEPVPCPGSHKLW